MFLCSIAYSDVRVEITRDLVDQKQIVVQQFHDMDAFEMWMVNRLETQGCDPYVTSVVISINPQNQTETDM